MSPYISFDYILLFVKYQVFLFNNNNLQRVVKYQLFLTLIILAHWSRGLSIRQNTKDTKMVLDPVSLNCQHYKVPIKGNVEQSGERSSTLSNASV